MVARLAVRRLLAAALLAALLALSAVHVAAAHASLVRANIAPDQVFPPHTYPQTITAFFAENVNPKTSWVHVFEGDPKGDHGLVDTGKNGFPFKNPKEITTTLPKGLKGRYTFIWFTQSADDGHIAGNAFTFTVK